MNWLRGGRHHALVEQPQPSERALEAHFAPEEDVAGDVERGRKSEILEDGFDAEPARVERATELHRPAVEEKLARVGDDRAAQHLDQLALAGAVVADQPENFAIP